MEYSQFSSALQKVLKNIEATQAKDIIVLIDENNLPSYPKLSSWGSITLDLASGGGLPKSRIIEIIGWESSGKTTVAISACVEVQKVGGVVAIVDMEQALSYPYIQNLGINLKNTIIIQPNSAEQALNCVEMLVESDEVDLIVLDSVAALVPQAELDGEAGDLKVGLTARLMSQHLRKVNPMINKTGCTVIYINQFREKISTGGGFSFDNKTLPGGNALKYYASQRMEVKRVGRIDAGNKDYTGNEIEVEFKKNKLAPPFKKAYFTIVYGEGISRESEIINACLDLELIIKTGSGPAPNFETPIWSGAIDTTEAKVIEALKMEHFKDLNFELEKRLDLSLNKITEEEFKNIMEPIWQKYRDDQKVYDFSMERANFWSGKSKYFESKFYANEALKVRPLDKVAKKKFEQMDQKIKERMLSFEGEIEFDDKIMTVIKGGIISDVEIKITEEK